MLNKYIRFGRNPVVLLGLITHYLAFYLILLNIAKDAPVASEAGTDLQAFISPKYVRNTAVGVNTGGAGDTHKHILYKRDVLSLMIGVKFSERLCPGRP